MSLGRIKLLDMMRAGFPAAAPAGDRFVIIGDNSSGVDPINVTAPGGGSTTLTISYTGTIADATIRKQYQLGTRVIFTEINFSSTPSVAVGEVLHVIAATATSITLSKSLYIPGETLPNAIAFDDTGSAVIRDLNAIELVGTGTAALTSEVYTAADAARYELDLGLTPNERPGWTPAASIIGVPSPGSSDESNEQRAIIQRTEMGSLTLPGDISYSALIFIESFGGQTASNIPFDTNGIVSAPHTFTTSQALLAGPIQSLLAEFSLL